MLNLRISSAVEPFSKGLTSAVYNDTIDMDSNDGIRLGVNSTPTVFINSRKMDVDPTYQNLKSVIDKELKRVQ